MNTKKDRIPVLVCINDFLIGGAQKVMAELLRHLDAERYELHLLILADFPGRPTFHRELPAHIVTHQLQMRSLLSVTGWWSVWKMLRQVRPSVILSNLYLTNTVMRVSAAFARIPVIAVEHNTYSNKNLLQHGIDWALSFVTYRIVAVSGAVADFVIHRQRIPSRKVEVIPNGIDGPALARTFPEESREAIRASLGISPDERVILHVGRLVPQKDPGLLIAGFAAFVQRSEDRPRLIVVGDGESREMAVRMAHDLGIADHVLFIGAADPARYYVASDLFLSTSLIEGFGLVRVEAFWYGLPVVGTDTGGTEELIREGKNGFVLRERTPEAVAEVIARGLALDTAVAKDEARATASLYSIGRMAERYEALLDGALRSARRTYD